MWTFLYRAAWAAAKTAAPLFASGDGKLARSVRGRQGGAAALAAWAARSRDTARRLVWFHAASVGEGRQAEAVLVRLRSARPGWQIVFTHSSASAERLARALPADFAGYIPADTTADTARALDAVRADALVFSATDLWPELVRQARSRGVRLGLVSATLAPTSSRRGGPARALLRETFAALDAVGAIDAADASGLVKLGVRPERVTVTGDTRHDAAAARAGAIDRGASHVAAITRSDAPVLVAGSTWPADERVLLPALAEVRARSPLALVIAPHEPDAAHLADLERRIAATLGPVRVARLSVLQAALPLAPSAIPAAWDVCLVDRVGILAELYAAAAMALVGGGFHKAGLHSVIEPAALGVPVVFGPEWRSSRDARLLLDQGGALCVPDRAALARALETWLRDPAARRAAGAAAREVVRTGLGAADRSLAIVLKLVDHSNREAPPCP